MVGPWACWSGYGRINQAGDADDGDGGDAMRCDGDLFLVFGGARQKDVYLLIASQTESQWFRCRVMSIVWRSVLRIKRFVAIALAGRGTDTENCTLKRRTCSTIV